MINPNDDKIDFIRRFLETLDKDHRLPEAALLDSLRIIRRIVNYQGNRTIIGFHKTQGIHHFFKKNMGLYREASRYVNIINQAKSCTKCTTMYRPASKNSVCQHEWHPLFEGE